MEVMKQTSVASSRGEEVEETQSIDSKDSQETKDNKDGKKWRDFRRLRTTKKLPEKTERQDPQRFFGDGVNFKAKMIGIKEVGQARGDRLAQDALFELKAAVKNSNTHKQRIIINVSVDGIKIKDEKGTEVLHHHPVHKISFIAQDVTDPRAFGYVFGSPQLGHKFFGIKTEKPAHMLVVAMRDLFQVVFEIRKKELQKKGIDIGDKNIPTELKASSVETELPKDGGARDDSTEIVAEKQTSDLYSVVASLEEDNVDSKLVDLETEVFYAQKAAAEEDDTDFFSNPEEFFRSFSTSCATDDDSFHFPPSANIPEKTRDQLNAKETNCVTANLADDSQNVPLFEAKFEDFAPATVSLSSEISGLDFSSTGSSSVPDKYAPLTMITTSESLEKGVGNSAGNSLFDDSFGATSGNNEGGEPDESPPPKPPRSAVNIFSNLDPLGDRPFIDKKDFFHEESSAVNKTSTPVSITQSISIDDQQTSSKRTNSERLISDSKDSSSSETDYEGDSTSDSDDDDA